MPVRLPLGGENTAARLRGDESARRCLDQLSALRKALHRPLIDLGYQDTMARREEVKAFLEES
jgi:hypothetical protein